MGCGNWWLVAVRLSFLTAEIRYVCSVVVRYRNEIVSQGAIASFIFQFHLDLGSMTSLALTACFGSGDCYDQVSCSSLNACKYHMPSFLPTKFYHPHSCYRRYSFERSVANVLKSMTGFQVVYTQFRSLFVLLHTEYMRHPGYPQNNILTASRSRTTAQSGKPIAKGHGLEPPS